MNNSTLTQKQELFQVLEFQSRIDTVLSKTRNLNNEDYLNESLSLFEEIAKHWKLSNKIDINNDINYFFKDLILKNLFNNIYFFLFFIKILLTKNSTINSISAFNEVLIKNISQNKEQDTNILLFIYIIFLNIHFKKLPNYQENLNIIEDLILKKLNNNTFIHKELSTFLLIFCNEKKLDFSLFQKNIQTTHYIFNIEVFFEKKLSKDNCMDLVLSDIENTNNTLFYYNLNALNNNSIEDKGLYFKNILYFFKEYFNSSSNTINALKYLLEYINPLEVNLLQIFKDNNIPFTLAKKLFTKDYDRFIYTSQKDLIGKIHISQIDYSLDIQKNTVMTIEEKIQFIENVLDTEYTNSKTRNNYLIDILYIIKNIDFNIILKGNFPNIKNLIFEEYITSYFNALDISNYYDEAFNRNRQSNRTIEAILDKNEDIKNTKRELSNFYLILIKYIKKDTLFNKHLLQFIKDNKNNGYLKISSLVIIENLNEKQRIKTLESLFTYNKLLDLITRKKIDSSTLNIFNKNNDFNLEKTFLLLPNILNDILIHFIKTEPNNYNKISLLVSNMQEHYLKQEIEKSKEDLENIEKDKLIKKVIESINNKLILTYSEDNKTYYIKEEETNEKMNEFDTFFKNKNIKNIDDNKHLIIYNYLKDNYFNLKINSIEYYQYGLAYNIISEKEFDNLIILDIIQSKSLSNSIYLKNISNLENELLKYDDKTLYFNLLWKYWYSFNGKHNFQELLGNDKIFSLFVNQKDYFNMLSNEDIIEKIVKEPFSSNNTYTNKQISFLKGLIEHTNGISIYKTIIEIANHFKIKINPKINEEFYYTNEDVKNDVFLI